LESFIRSRRGVLSCFHGKFALAMGIGLVAGEAGAAAEARRRRINLGLLRSEDGKTIRRGMNCAANCAAKVCRRRTSRGCWRSWTIITKI